MRLSLYLLALFILPIITLTTGCENQNEQEMGFGPNPGDRLVDEEDSSE